MNKTCSIVHLKQDGDYRRIYDTAPSPTRLLSLSCWLVGFLVFFCVSFCACITFNYDVTHRFNDDDRATCVPTNDPIGPMYRKDAKNSWKIKFLYSFRSSWDLLLLLPLLWLLQHRSSWRSLLKKSCLMYDFLETSIVLLFVAWTVQRSWPENRSVPVCVRKSNISILWGYLPSQISRTNLTRIHCTAS